MSILKGVGGKGSNLHTRGLSGEFWHDQSKLEPRLKTPGEYGSSGLTRQSEEASESINGFSTAIPVVISGNELSESEIGGPVSSEDGGISATVVVYDDIDLTGLRLMLAIIPRSSSPFHGANRGIEGASRGGGLHASG